MNQSESSARTALRAGKVAAAASALLVGMMPGLGRAAGFQINEHSARATGMASSVVASIEDPSAIFHNPAGLTKIEGTEFVAGLNLIVPHGAYTGPGLPNSGGNPGGEELVNDPVPVPYVYAARKLSDTAYVGLGFYLPYGSGLAWRNKETFSGRTQIEELSLRTFYFTPTVAIEFNEVISAAVGVSLVPATLLLKRTLGATDTQEPLFPNGGSVALSATAFGVGANAGIQIHATKNLHFGLNYRSAVNLSFSGEANFDVPDDAPLAVQQNFPDQTGNGEITIPHAFSIGAAFTASGWTVEVGSQLTLWESYDELRLNFDTGRPTPSSASPRNWNNVALFRGGVQYDSGTWAARVGGGYDMSPSPDTTADFTLPDNDRVYASLGFGYDFGLLSVDVGYMALWIMEREIDTTVNVNVPTGGTFNGGFAHVASLSLATQFD